MSTTQPTTTPLAVPQTRPSGRILTGLALSLALGSACDAGDELDNDTLEWREGKGEEKGQGEGADGGEGQTHARTVDVSALPTAEEVVCDKRFSASAAATRPVETCENAPFSELYDHAKREAKTLIDNVPCPEACPYKETWTTAHMWSCFNEFPNASVTVQASGICSEKPTDDYQDAIKPSDDEFASSQWSEEGVFESVPAVVDVVPPTAPPTDEEPCGSVRQGSYLHQSTALCDDETFSDLHFDAIAGAEDYHAGFGCPLGCMLEPFEVGSENWICSLDQPSVEITFDIVCTEL